MYGRFLAALFMLLGMTATESSWAWFSSCDDASTTPKPDWVERTDYSIPGFYVGVGVAEKGKKSNDERRKASEDDARSQLTQHIEVTAHAETRRVKEVRNNKDVQELDSVKIEVKAEEVLRGLDVKGKWIDRDTCTEYTLMVIRREAVEQARREKEMRARLEKVNQLLADGTDRDKTRDAQARRKALDEAKVTFAGIDFALIHEEYRKEALGQKIETALRQADQELAESQARLAVCAINGGGKVPAAVIGWMVGQVHEDKLKAERLTDDCSSAEDGLGKARERGFGALAILKVDSKVEVSNMGALKGTLTVSKTVFNLATRQAIKGPTTASAQVIGWGNEELDWNAAAEKIAGDLK